MVERLLQQLGDQEMQRLLVEGGPSTVERFLRTQSLGMLEECREQKSHKE